MAEREVGTIKWFNPVKRYGFIGREQGDDVFVHLNSIQEDGLTNLEEGQKVEFIVVEGEKGLRAEELTVVKEEQI
jgi:CspA family cold shock protein